MAQVAHVDVGTEAVELSDGLSAGCYIAQPRQYGDALILCATADTAPTDDDDYFVCDGRAFFRFSVASSLPPTWAKARVGTIPVALALDPA